MSDNFNYFIINFKNSWETETLQDISELKKNRFSYEITPNKKVIYVYQWNKYTVIARFEPERCWIDNTTLSRILRDILPEYLPYFLNQKNLTQTGLKIDDRF